MTYLLYSVSINTETLTNCDLRLSYIQTEDCSSTIDRYTIIYSINKNEQHRMGTLELK